MLFSLSAHFVEKFSGRTAIAFCHGFPEPLLFFLVHDSHALVSPDQLQQIEEVVLKVQTEWQEQE